MSPLDWFVKLDECLAGVSDILANTDSTCDCMLLSYYHIHLFTIFNNNISLNKVCTCSMSLLMLININYCNTYIIIC